MHGNSPLPRRLVFLVSVLLVNSLVASFGAATPARAATADYTLSLSASDLGLDPAVMRSVVPQIQSEIAADGGLSASIKHEISTNPPSGVGTVDIASLPDFDGTLALGSDGASMTITVPGAEVQPSASWWQNFVAITIGALAGYGLRILCIGALTASGVGAAIVPLVCTPLQGAVTGFISGLVVHAFAKDLSTRTAWIDIIVRTLVGAIVGGLWEKYFSPFAKNYLPGALRNIGNWVLTKVPAIQRLFGSAAGTAAESAATFTIELEEFLQAEISAWSDAAPVLPDPLRERAGRQRRHRVEPEVLRVISAVAAVWQSGHTAAPCGTYGSVTAC